MEVELKQYSGVRKTWQALVNIGGSTSVWGDFLAAISYLRVQDDCIISFEAELKALRTTGTLQEKPGASLHFKIYFEPEQLLQNLEPINYPKFPRSRYTAMALHCFL